MIQSPNRMSLGLVHNKMENGDSFGMYGYDVA